MDTCCVLRFYVKEFCLLPPTVGMIVVATAVVVVLLVDADIKRLHLLKLVKKKIKRFGKRSPADYGNNCI